MLQNSSICATQFAREVLEMLKNVANAQVYLVKSKQICLFLCIATPTSKISINERKKKTNSD